MKTRFAITLSAFWCLTGSATAQTLFYNIGNLGQGVGSDALGLSRDGGTVVGMSSFGAFGRAIKWTVSGGMTNLGVLSLGFSSTAYGASSNGAVIAGFGDPHAFRWTQGTGMTTLGSLDGGANSVARAISSDGNVIVGQSSTQSGPVAAFRWTQGTGMVNLGYLPNGSAVASAGGVNQDGSVVVGYSLKDDGQHAFRWTQAGGMADLGVGYANAVSDNGSVVVGGAGNGNAFRWTQATGMQNIGGNLARAVSSDGSIVGGSANNRAFLWSSATGLVDLNEFLPTQGVDLTGWVLTSTSGISSNGQSVCGQGTFNGSPRGWYVSGLKLSTSDWVQWGGNGHWYRAIYIPAGCSWVEADIIARQQGGHLATMTTAAENDFVFSLADDPRYFVTDPNNGNIYGPWIGLVQAANGQEPGGGWGWVTGEAFSYTRWFPGEPNNTAGQEDWGCFLQKSGNLGPFWNDLFDGSRPRNNPQLTSLIVESPYPPSEWTQWGGNGHWYKAVSCPAGIRWTDAQAQATMEGGYLATTTTTAENSFVYNLLFSDRFRIPDSTNQTYISGWLGLFQPDGAPEPSGGWLWSSLEQDTFRNWASGEPNNFLDIEDFANYRYPIGSSNSGWNDFPNSGYPGEFVPSFVIERDTAPLTGNPAVTALPSTVTLTRGNIASGLLPDLFEIDTDLLQFKKGIVINQSEAPINFTVGTTSPWNSARAMTLNMSLRANSTSVQMTTEALDWVSQSYVVIDQRLTPTAETLVAVNLTFPERFIKFETREIRTRVSFKPIGPVSQQDWRVFINWFKHDVTP
ncbi:MAG: hypothetical protein JNM34_00685 [Chthonomonadaceae bacterium]|nr:hypothetical protein [Chthonomonadaceae bacterium]